MLSGGFCPLPIRLSTEAKTGWSAAQHARFANDTAAVFRSSAFALLTATIDNTAETVTLASYLGHNGGGAVHAPTLTWVNPGIAELEWQPVYETVEGESRQLAIYQAQASAAGSTALIAHYAIGSDRNKLTVYLNNAAGGASEGTFCVKVRARWREQSKIGDYGGDPNKRDTSTEVIPYAWSWYQSLTSALPDGLTRNQSGELHAKKLAYARNLMGVDRTAERFRANTIPATAHETLASWVSSMRVLNQPEDPDWKLRQRCAQKMKHWKGFGSDEVDAAISDLLGDYLETIVRYHDNDLDTPPDPTYWPGVNPGPASYDIGGGTWTSRRAHVLVVVKNLSKLDPAERDFLLNTELVELLDRMLPADCTFSWGTSGPFLVGISLIGLDSL